MSRISIEHVRLTVDRPFDSFRTAFEGQLGHFHPSAYEALEHGDPRAARAELESMTGPSGFMLFGTSDHGAVLRLVGILAGQFDKLPPGEARRRALVSASTMIGALAMARMVTDPELSAEILREAEASITEA